MWCLCVVLVGSFWGGCEGWVEEELGRWVLVLVVGVWSSVGEFDGGEELAVCAGIWGLWAPLWVV